MNPTRIKQAVGAVLVGFMVVSAYLLSSANFLQGAEKEKLEALSSIENCLKAEKRNSCFKAVSQEFVGKDKLEMVFEILEENQQTPKIFESCHVFLHFAGQAAYKKIGNISDTLKRGNYVCFAGFYHGALEGYFIENNLLASNDGGWGALREKVPQICIEADSVTKKDYFECLHGLGHGLMFAADGELPQVLELCDALGDPAKASWCYSGAFMENSTSTTNPDHPSKYLKPDDPFYPCNILAEKYLQTCYILQSMRMTHETEADWPEVASFCLKVPARQRSACFNGIGQSLVGWSTDPLVVRDNCLKFQTEYQNDCIAGAAGGTGEKYKPPFDILGGLCSAFEGAHHVFCYEYVFRSMNNWAVSRKELEDFCESVQDALLRETCEDGIRL